MKAAGERVWQVADMLAVTAAGMSMSKDQPACCMNESHAMLMKNNDKQHAAKSTASTSPAARGETLPSQPFLTLHRAILTQ